MAIPIDGAGADKHEEERRKRERGVTSPKGRRDVKVDDGD